ncbi:hypothetical protein ANANG_G00002570 [Anguilla anguilla]|uniref:Uncharacterized protein n=1 Tax=Anguilla anguilla TaxID=7936 RepID=A0A9D3MVR7_ANGAN|nr:hypothetical protein ANANG_G00002570 [Anguilla anguilla]
MGSMGMGGGFIPRTHRLGVQAGGGVHGGGVLTVRSARFHRLPCLVHCRAAAAALRTAGASDVAAAGVGAALTPADTNQEEQQEEAQHQQQHQQPV